MWWRLTWVLVVIAANGCSATPMTVLLRVEADDSLRPEVLFLDVFDDQAQVMAARRLPPVGIKLSLPANAVLYPPRPGRLRLLLRAERGDKVIGEGADSVVARAQEQVGLTLRLKANRLPDADGDGIPDRIDRCPKVPNPRQEPCGTADAGLDRPIDLRDARVDAGDGRPIDARPADGRPIDARPADGRPIDARPADGRPIDARPADGRPIDAVRLADSRPIDAARPADTLLPDIGVCPIGCTRCVAGVCEIVCGKNGCVCPPGVPCRLLCETVGACQGTVSCGKASRCEVVCSQSNSCGGDINCGAFPCTITCGGRGSCSQNIYCGPGSCTVNCVGTDSCRDPIRCQGSGACKISCSGLRSCHRRLQCGAGPCTVDCSGNGACGDPVKCGQSCGCSVSCAANACGSRIECPSQCAKCGPLDMCGTC